MKIIVVLVVIFWVISGGFSYQTPLLPRLDRELVKAEEAFFHAGYPYPHIVFIVSVLTYAILAVFALLDIIMIYTGFWGFRTLQKNIATFFDRALTINSRQIPLSEVINGVTSESEIKNISREKDCENFGFGKKETSQKNFAQENIIEKCFYEKKFFGKIIFGKTFLENFAKPKSFEKVFSEKNIFAKIVLIKNFTQKFVLKISLPFFESAPLKKDDKGAISDPGLAREGRVPLLGLAPVRSGYWFNRDSAYFSTGTDRGKIGAVPCGDRGKGSEMAGITSKYMLITQHIDNNNVMTKEVIHSRRGRLNVPYVYGPTGRSLRLNVGYGIVSLQSRVDPGTDRVQGTMGSGYNCVNDTKERFCILTNEYIMI